MREAGTVTNLTATPVGEEIKPRSEAHPLSPSVELERRVTRIAGGWPRTERCDHACA